MRIVIYGQISIPTNFYSITSRWLKSNYKVHKKARSVHLSFKERGKNEKFYTLDSPDMYSELCKPTNFIIFESLYKVTFGTMFLMKICKIFDLNQISAREPARNMLIILMKGSGTRGLRLLYLHLLEAHEFCAPNAIVLTQNEAYEAIVLAFQF